MAHSTLKVSAKQAAAVSARKSGISSDMARKLDKRQAAAVATLRKVSGDEMVKGGLGLAQKLFGVGFDGALLWLLDWRARGYVASALAGRAADLVLATFNGAEKTVSVRTGKGKVTVWRVRVSTCGRFYSRTHSDKRSEGEVRGFVEALDAITVA